MLYRVILLCLVGMFIGACGDQTEPQTAAPAATKTPAEPAAATPAEPAAADDEEKG